MGGAVGIGVLGDRVSAAAQPMSGVPIRVQIVAERPELIPAMAPWLWEEWGRRKGRTLETVCARLAARVSRLGPEQSFILLDNGVAAGTASLVHDDLDERPELTPGWPASSSIRRGAAGASLGPGAGGGGGLHRRQDFPRSGCTRKAPRRSMPGSAGSRWGRPTTMAMP